jgi:hypothetical protein
MQMQMQMQMQIQMYGEKHEWNVLLNKTAATIYYYR